MEFHVDSAWSSMPCLHGKPCGSCMEWWRPGGCRGREGGPGMLRTIGEGRSRQRASVRCRFPERRLHLVDIENLAGASLPGLGEVREVRAVYTERLAFGTLDQVEIASSHLTLVNAALGWPHAHYRVRSGPD